MTDGAARWADALLAARLLVCCPAALRGAVVRARAGPIRDAWLEALRDALPADAVWRRLPPGMREDRLLGGLDLAASLAAGRAVAEPGLLAEARGGVLVVPMAERMPLLTAALLADAIDRGRWHDALGAEHGGRFLAILLDEGVEDEQVPELLAERLAFRLDLDGLRLADLLPGEALRDAMLAEGAGEPVADPVAPICAAAATLGVGSLRAPAMALAAARAHAQAAHGTADRLTQPDLMAAARLVLAPRATRLPPAGEQADTPPPAPETDSAAAPPDMGGADADRAGSDAAELLVETARAALPPGLLEALAASGRGVHRSMAPGGGRGAGRLGRAPTSGRGTVVRAGRPGPGFRLDLVETLKAAAPWQGLRQRERAGTGIQVRVSDFRVRRLVRRMGSTILLLVDASGSSAMARLGEAKGAAELLLADAYVRRDDVGLIAFRGTMADVLLPPTRSLPRARRALADLAGGGGTPMATAIDTARAQALAVRARGRTPLVVLLTDGRANIAADGTASATRAADDALASARALRADGIRALLIDTAARPRPEGRTLAEALGARLVALPRLSAGSLRDAVRAEV